jgi:hypothetical protein
VYGALFPGVSPSLPQEQLQLARSVAQHIGTPPTPGRGTRTLLTQGRKTDHHMTSPGIPLHEVPTREAEEVGYIENKGMSCFHCKTHLYSALEAVAVAAHAGGHKAVRLFNGTNKDDRTDPTRVGLRAASDFRVGSPIDHLTKTEVRGGEGPQGGALT